MPPRYRFMSSYEQKVEAWCGTHTLLFAFCTAAVDVGVCGAILTQSLLTRACLGSRVCRDKRYQYLVFAAEPYEIIAFKVRTREEHNLITPLSI